VFTGSNFASASEDITAVNASGVNSFLAARYRSTFQPWLHEDEILLNAGVAIQVETSERLGRGVGDGILGLTNRRIVHVFDSPFVAGGGVAIDRQNIRSVSSHWIALPMNRRLQVRVGMTDGQSILNFYVGKRYCREIELLLAGSL